MKKYNTIRFLKSVSLLLLVSLAWAASNVQAEPILFNTEQQYYDCNMDVMFDSADHKTTRTKINGTIPNTDQWLKQIDKKLAAEPYNFYLYFDKAHVYQMNGKYAEAIKLCNQGLAKKRCGFGLYRLASIELCLGLNKKAIEHATAALSLLPDNIEILMLRMTAANEQAVSEQAMKDELKILVMMDKRVDERIASVKSLLDAKYNGPRAMLASAFNENEVNSYFFRSISGWKSKKHGPQEEEGTQQLEEIKPFPEPVSYTNSKPIQKKHKKMTH